MLKLGNRVDLLTSIMKAGNIFPGKLFHVFLFRDAFFHSLMYLKMQQPQNQNKS